MVAQNNKRRYVRCHHCGKQPVALKRERIQAHTTPTGGKCPGVGQRALTETKEQ